MEGTQLKRILNSYGKTNLLSVVLPFIISSSSLLGAQVGDEYTLKAALAYNFAKYTQWSPSLAGQTIEFCFFNDMYSESFAPLINRTIDNKRIVIKRLPNLVDIESCDLIYLDRDNRAMLEAISNLPAGRAILTISDLSGFSENGGMIEIQTIDNRLRFKINLITAQEAGITFGSQVLSLATEVIR